MKTRSRSIFNLLVVFAILISLLGSAMTAMSARAAGLCYVNDNAGGDNNGTSWVNAYTSLQSAIVDSCTEIWVAAGIYKPHASDQTVSFTLENGTAIYGGFAGTESLLSERNPTTNIAVLSGDLNGNDNIHNVYNEPTREENSHHVVVGSGTNNTAVLDGFTISGGNAIGTSGEDIASYGGGIYNDTGDPTITNVTFRANYAYFGSGIYNKSSSPTLTNVTFNGNIAGGHGGGMYNLKSNPKLTNVTFNTNGASFGGGGMFNDISSPILTNVTFSANSAGGGGGMANTESNPILTNVTFSNNFAGSGGGMYNRFGSIPMLKNVIIANSNGGDCFNDTSTANDTSTVNAQNSLIEDDLTCVNGTNKNNLTGDPMLGPLADNGGFTQTFALLAGSPAINAGTNTDCPATDQRGAVRPQDGTCDIGAYELINTFTDVSAMYWANSFIERLYSAHITGGCVLSPLQYCPDTSVTRAQMAVFLEKGLHGSGFTPPAATGTKFTDVSTSYWAAAWIEALAADGITGGCGNSNYCPDAEVTRAQMAVFLLKSAHGSSYAPPSATGTKFTDVASTYWAAAWVEQLAAEGITTGCGAGVYCPDSSVTRAQMAVFLVKVFKLP